MIFSEQPALRFPFVEKIMGSSSYFESYLVFFLINFTCYFNNTRESRLIFFLRVRVMVSLRQFWISISCTLLFILVFVKYLGKGILNYWWYILWSEQNYTVVNVISLNLSWHKWNLLVHLWFVCSMTLLFEGTIVYCCKFWLVYLISACWFTALHDCPCPHYIKSCNW